LAGKPFFKLAPRLRIVLPGNRRMLVLAHAAIMAQVELNGQPLQKHSYFDKNRMPVCVLFRDIRIGGTRAIRTAVRRCTGSILAGNDIAR
ncbi:hypothetical protein, partial [Paraburkholderia sp.]|uniref:hypothetical protein n=1 Tax=Paraburkholderia sp. TaxID=1926495 RepID=UPI003D6FA11C